MDRRLACEVELSSTGDCRRWKQFIWTSPAEICDAMYDVKTQFFPQFLTFKMAEESLALARFIVVSIQSLFGTGRFDTNWSRFETLSKTIRNITCRKLIWFNSIFMPVAGGLEPSQEIFRFELNSAKKVELCLLKWTAVIGSYSSQVLSIILRLCTVVLLSNLKLSKGTKSYFCFAKYLRPTALKYLLIFYQSRQKQNGSKRTNNNPWTWPLGLFWFLRSSPV